MRAMPSPTSITVPTLVGAHRLVEVLDLVLQGADDVFGTDAHGASLSLLSLLVRSLARVASPASSGARARPPGGP